MKQLLHHIAGYHRLSADAASAIEMCCQEKLVQKGAHLVQQGDRCRHLYFIEQGLLRGYYHADGKEMTHWFSFENDFATSFHSFITGEPAVENIQAGEGCMLWRIGKEDLSVLCSQYHEIERLLRLTYEQYYLRLEERFINSQFKTAAERYQQLLLQHPHIVERVPVGQIASYLGISPETLSRVRAQL